MKFSSLLSRRPALVIALASFLSLCTTLFAQPPEIGSTLEGNAVIDNGMVSDGEGNQYYVGATSQAIYVADMRGLSSPTHPSFDGVYKAPEGTSIRKIATKIDTSTAFVLAKSTRIIVLLSDNTVIELDFKPFPSSSPTVFVLNRIGNIPQGSDFTIKGDAVYALLETHVYVTRDTGTTWQIDSSGLGSAFVWDIALDSLQNVYAATGNGLFRQNPDSNVWHRVATLTSPTNLWRIFIDRLSRIFVVGSGAGGLVISADNGASWNSDTTGIGTLEFSLLCDDAFGNIYGRGFDGALYKSPGGTGAWTKIDAGILDSTLGVPSITAIAGDTLLCVATSVGNFISSDQGASWTQNNAGIHAENFYGFTKFNTSGRIVVSTDLGIFYNDPGDSLWQKSYPPTGSLGLLNIYRDSTKTMYTVLRNPDLSSHALGPVLTSTDFGVTWVPDTLGLSSTVGQVFFVDDLGKPHIGSSYFGSTFYSRAYQQDTSGQWVTDTMGFPTGNFSYTGCFGVDRAGRLYASGYYQNGPRVLSRPLSGGAWSRDTTGLPFTVNHFSIMKPGAPGDLFGTDNTSLYRHSGGVWSLVYTPSASILKFSVDNLGTIFLAQTALTGFVYSDIGITMSTDNGATWTMVTHDTIPVQILHSNGDTTYAILQGGGFYKLTRNGIVTSVKTRMAQIPSAYELGQNYPNPFNPSTAINYDLPWESRVTLRIYNLLGQRIATLVDGIEGAGYKSVKWNASSVASGTYLVRLDATAVAKPGETFTRTIKMELLK